MFRPLLLLSAVFAMSMGAAAQASTLLASGTIGDSNPPHIEVFSGDFDGGVFRFRTSEKMTATWVEVDGLVRLLGHSLDGKHHWGSSSYLQTTIPPFGFTARSDGFSISVNLPADRTVYSDGCIDDSCGLEELTEYIVKIYFAADFAPGAAGKTWTFEKITTSTVPEPATWAMMIAGFGLTGLVIRRHRFQPRLSAVAA